jgi:glyoxylase-like metal-dependent hydrolase (beta-lactamase superfamily II)
VTPLEGAVMLLGLIALPLALLSIGHGYRRAGRRLRGTFWGGVVGYGIGVVLWSWALLAPPVLWDEASPRIAVVVLALLASGVLGMGIGAVIGRRPRRRPGARGASGGASARSGATALVLAAIPAMAATTAGALAGGAPLEAQEPADLFVVTELDRDVLLAETAPGVPSSAYASSVAVLGSAGVLIVDTFHGPAAMDWFLDRIAERTDAPVRWVVNTHGHGDHIWGNAAVRDRFPEATIHAHPETAARVAAEGGGALEAERTRLDRRLADLESRLAALPEVDERRPEVETLVRRIRAQRSEADRVRVVAPDSPVESFERIDVGSRTVWLQSLPPAHTDGDMVVWIDGILVAGDLVEEGLPWIEGADIESWARVLADLAARGPALVIAGHGGRPESSERAALLHLQRDALVRSVTEARRLRDGGGANGDAFADLRVRFAEWGVEGKAFDEWMASAVAAAREGPGSDAR